MIQNSIIALQKKQPGHQIKNLIMIKTGSRNLIFSKD